MSTKYRNQPGLSSGLLMDYAKHGGDYVLAKRKKPLPDSWEFFYGRAFEGWVEHMANICQKKTSGKNWHSEYFLLEDQGAGISKPFSLEWIKQPGIDWESKSKRNKPKKGQELGDLSKKHKNYNYLIQQCAKNPGKYPITDDIWQMLCANFESFKKIRFRGLPFAEILPYCEFQAPFYWNSEIMLPGATEPAIVPKKALVDMLVLEQGDEFDTLWSFDIKTTASFIKFRKDLINKYYIQATHYTEGLKDYYKRQADKPVRVMPMQFIVVSKAESDLFQAALFPIDPDTWATARTRYQELVEKYVVWKMQGFPEQGWKGVECVKIY